jgi:hypothetical protein
MTVLIEPPHLNYREERIPRSYDIINERLLGSDMSREDKYWKNVYPLIDQLYNKNSFTLKPGTLLYRCSISPKPMTFSKSQLGSPLIYFGLDFVIATWIGLEINDRNKKPVPCYLHVYKLKKPVKYHYIEEVEGTVLDFAPEVSLETACIHPQTVLHGDDPLGGVNDVGIEITFPRSVNLSSIIKPIQTYKINTTLLKKNTNKYLFEWNPRQALSQVKSTRKNISRGL